MLLPLVAVLGRALFGPEPTAARPSGIEVVGCDLLVLSRGYGNKLYRDDTGIIFPYSLPRTSKLRFRAGVLGPTQDGS